MIVLGKDKLEKFYTIKEHHQSELDDLGCDYIPVEIKNDLFILPNECLQDEKFLNLYGDLVRNEEMIFEVRDIKEDELIEALSIVNRPQENESKNLVVQYYYKVVDSIKSIFS